jgi:hypothetical protein
MEHREKSTYKYRKCTYVSNLSEELQRIVKKHDDQIRFGFKNTKSLAEIYPRLKDKITQGQKHSVVYKINCNDCSGVYIGQTGTKLNTRMSNHKSENKTRDKRNTLALTASTQHCKELNHTMNYKEPNILHQETALSKRLTLEMLYINENKDAVNIKTDNEKKLFASYAGVIKTFSRRDK